MKSNPENNTFFPSGCLAQETMKRFLAGDLSLSEKAKAEDHLSHCELCRDAMEGFGMVSDHKLFEHKVSEIKQKIDRTFLKVRPGYEPRTIGMNKRFFYLSAAASVIILLGLYFILQYKLPTHPPLLTTAGHIDTEEKAIPPKPVAEKQTDDNSIEMPGEVSDVNETPAVEIAEIQKEMPSTQQMASPAQQDQPVKEQIRNIPESISQSNQIREILMDDDQDEPAAGAFNQGVDIASIGPVEYFLPGITFFNELTGNKSSEDQETVDRNPAAALTKTIRSKAHGQPNISAMESPEILTEDEHIAMDKEQVFDSTGIQEHFFVLVDQMPQFPGGDAALSNYLQKALRYPEVALKYGIEGTVSVSFIIEENGQVSSVKVNHGPGQGIDEETIRVISEMPPWLPALQDGMPVRALLTMPVTFRLR